jgi:hypothetical protein
MQRDSDNARAIQPNGAELFGLSALIEYREDAEKVRLVVGTPSALRHRFFLDAPFFGAAFALERFFFLTGS